MWDCGLLIGAAELRVIHALISDHAASALALASWITQVAWLQLRSRGVPPSRRSTIAQLVRIGLSGIVFAALPPGSRLVVTLVDRAARLAVCSRFTCHSAH